MNQVERLLETIDQLEKHNKSLVDENNYVKQNQKEGRQIYVEYNSLMNAIQEYFGEDAQAYYDFVDSVFDNTKDLVLEFFKEGDNEK